MDKKVDSSATGNSGQFLGNSLSYKQEVLKRRGKIDFKKWNVIKILGRGAYGCVFLVCHDRRSHYAMKVYDKVKIVESNLQVNTMNERMILTDAGHPFVLKLHYSFQTSQRLYFIMDYVPGGDLFNYIKK